MKSKESTRLTGKRNTRKRLGLSLKRYRLRKADPIVVSTVLTLTGDAPLGDKRD